LLFISIMLHELIFVLLGYPGDVFRPHDNSTFAIAPDFPLLHPTERECLNRLGQLGWTFSQINLFINNVKDLKSTTSDPTKPHGAYIQALVTTIEITLTDYRRDILAMEKRILNRDDEAGGGVVPLSLLTANLSRWSILLPALYNFVQIVQQESTKYHGCKLLDLVMDQARTGVYEFRAEMEKMMVQLHDVLYRQLTAWMVYGQWVDPDNEFFIVPYQQTETANVNHTAWHRLYVIAYDRIPSHLSHALVESVLFVGKAIATVNEMDKPLLSQQQQKIQIPKEMREKHLQLLLSLHSSCLPSLQTPWIRYPQQLQNVVSQVRRSTADWLFSQVLINEHGLHRYLDSFRHVFLLNYGDLAANFIDECAQWRRRSLQRSSDQQGSRERTSSPSNKSSRTAIIFRHQELNALLNKASIGTEAEDNLSGFSLLLEDESTQQYPFSDLLLVDLRVILTFDLVWPIDLFLSKSDLKHYSHLWSFLISLKNVQMALNNLWKILRSTTASQEEITNEDGFHERVVWRLRSFMLFWIDIYWNHIQVCSLHKYICIYYNTNIYQSHVIESHYQQLISDITTSSTTAKRRSWQASKTKLDFEEIQAAHEQFLNNTMRGCLLKSKECVKTVHQILRTCLDFCDLLSRLSEEGEWRKNAIIKRRKTTAKTAAEIVNQWTKPDTALTWMDDVHRLEEVLFLRQSFKPYLTRFL
jgi:gamma-tubulin complex component 4